MEIEVKQQGPNNTILFLGTVAALILAVVAWQMQIYIGTAILLVAAGEGGRRFLIGVAAVVVARGEAIAKITEAERGMIDGPRPRYLED